MSNPLDVIKKSVRELRAYTLKPDRASVKLNQNENPWDMPGEIKEESLRRFNQRAWSRYPDFVPTELREQLARFVGWQPEGVFIGNGSNEILLALLTATVGRGTKVLLSEPTFAIYRQVVTVLEGEVISVPLTRELAHDAAALGEAIEQHQPAVTIICSPNNPTGGTIADDDLRSLLRTAHGIIAVDEAYFEFARHTVAPLLTEHPNLIVFRTFSKAMAAAALRIGYMLASPELTREIGKVVLPYNINSFSLIVAEVALEMYDAELRESVDRIIAERSRLFDELKRIPGLEPTPSAANFFVVRSEIPPPKLYAELFARDILVRDVSSAPMLGSHVRISVGTPEENNKLIAALHQVAQAKQEA